MRKIAFCFLIYDIIHQEEVWNLFFKWQNHGDKDSKEDNMLGQLTLDEQDRKLAEEKDEKRKRELLKLETAMNDF